MIEREVADPMVKRLRALQREPLSQTAVEQRLEAREALCCAAENAGHAESIIAHLLKFAKWFPTPSEVWQAAEVVPPPQQMRPIDPRCAYCRGTGFWYPDAQRKAVAPCVCRRLA